MRAGRYGWRTAHYRLLGIPQTPCQEIEGFMGDYAIADAFCQATDAIYAPTAAIYAPAERSTSFRPVDLLLRDFRASDAFCQSTDAIYHSGTRLRGALRASLPFRGVPTPGRRRRGAHRG